MPETLFYGAKKLFSGIVSGAGFFPPTVCHVKTRSDMMLIYLNFIERYYWSIIANCSQSLTLSALTMDNMDGDYFVVGYELVDGDDLWKEIQASFFYLTKIKTNNIPLNPLEIKAPWPRLSLAMRWNYGLIGLWEILSERLARPLPPSKRLGQSQKSKHYIMTV